MKRMKHVLAMLLCLAMVLGLAACGGTSTGGSAPASSAPASSAPASNAPASTPAAGSSGSAAPASSSSKKLTVYTAFPESEVIYYFNKFTEETGIEIEYIRLSAGEMLTRVEAEKDNPQAALMFGGSTDNYIAAVDKGLLEPYQSPELSSTPSTYIDPTGTWNPIYVGCIAFACNADWFKEHNYSYPESWDDLLDPKYQGEIIMAHPATSGTAYTVLATLLQLKGEDASWDYLAKLSKNMSQYTKSGSAAPNAVALGEAAIALTFSHDALQLTPEGYHIELSFPKDGTGFEVGAVALIKGGPADEQENAKRFIDWICSVNGQGCYAENDSFRVPTNTAAPVAKGLVTLDQVPVIDYNAVWAASNKTKYCEEFESRIVAKPTE